jgi:hypothetical protein
MNDGTPWAGGCFAASEFTAVQDLVALMLRLLLSGLGVFLGWLLAKPLARGVYRLAFQRPIPPRVLTASRMSAAIVCGVLVFLLFPLGYGGGGGGRGGGKGPGVGPGSASGNDKGGNDKGGKDDKGVAPLPGKPGETVRIALIASDKYKHDQRWYLIDGKEPARTLAEVEAYLKQHQDQVKRLDIALNPAINVDPGHEAVKTLRKLAKKYELPVYPP